MWKYSTLKVTNHISLYRHELQCVRAEQNRDVLTSSGCTHKLRVLTQFFLDPTFDCCSCLVVHEKEWENLPDFWVCWSVSLCPWTASSIDAAVGCVTSVQPCQKGRSLMLPKFLQPSSSISSFPSNLSTLQDISHMKMAFPFSAIYNVFFFSLHRIGNYSSTNFGFLHIVKVIRGACFVFVVLPFSWPDFVRWCWCHDVSPPPPQSIKSSFSFDFLVTCRPALQFL